MIPKQERRSRSSTRVIRFWTDLINQRDLDRNGWMDRSAPHERWKARDTTQGSQGRGGTDGWIEVHHTRDGKLVIQHRVLKAVEVLVSQDNERGGEFLLESSRVFF
ncbi:hypothetical protein F2Q69_00035018 [Brassica cretica]|uniref:Uncharacterized protein n=1 Tax=Brassica cretica TaxID=69181 RepID=A0A8S9SAQ0_BRACR|nr:hypothetical protein F2Q69_00035018 [Brassica cretica]